MLGLRLNSGMKRFSPLAMIRDHGVRDGRQNKDKDSRRPIRDSSDYRNRRNDDYRRNKIDKFDLNNRKYLESSNPTISHDSAERGPFNGEGRNKKQFIQNNGNQVRENDRASYSSKVQSKHTSSRSIKKSTTNHGEKERQRFVHPAQKMNNSVLIPPTLQAMPRVILQAGKARIFQEGNPIVYSGAIQSTLSGKRGQPKSGDEVLVCDQHGNLFARGLYNEVSQYKVRIIEWLSSSNAQEFEQPLEDLLVNKLRAAKALRESLGLPSASLSTNPAPLITNAYRLVNSEGDGLSGLIVDVFQDIILVHSSAYWVEQSREIVCNALRRVFQQNDNEIKIHWKIAASRLKQDGFPLVQSDAMVTDNVHDVDGDIDESSNVKTRESSDESLSMSPTLIITENGVKYGINPEVDQKTGFYCDQRENRQLIRDLIAKKVPTGSGIEEPMRVLDLYCYSGGFSMNAILGGASQVVAVDSSRPALKNALNNADLNGMTSQLFDDVQDYQSKRVQRSETMDVSKSSMPSGRIDFIEGDCSQVMTELANFTVHNDSNKFDVIICDPPKLAPTRSSLERAYHKYVQINAQAMQLLKSSNSGGGLLLTCTCSAAMTQSSEKGLTFHSMLMKAAKVANRRITFLQQSNAARDHVVSLGYPESNYLTAVLLYVH